MVHVREARCPRIVVCEGGVWRRCMQTPQLLGEVLIEWRVSVVVAIVAPHAHCAPRTETLAVPSTTSESLVTDATSKPSQLRPVTSTVSGPCVTTWSGMATRRFPSHARTGSSDAPARWGLTTSTSDTAHAHVVAGDAIPPDFDRRARIARARVLR